MGRSLRFANEALALALELGALASLCYWGIVAGQNTAARLLLGIGCPAFAAAVWGLFAAPRARIKLPLAGVLTVKVIVFASAAAALFGAGLDALAIAFSALVVVNTTAVTIWRSRSPL